MFKSTLLLIKSSINPAARKSRRQKPVLTITLSTPFFQCGCVREVPAIRSTAGLPASSSPRWTDADDVAPFRRAAQLPWKLRSDGVAVLHCHWLERGGAPAVGPRWVWLQMREEAELWKQMHNIRVVSFCSNTHRCIHTEIYFIRAICTVKSL